MSGGKSRPRRQKSGGGSRFGNLSGRINAAERIFGADPNPYVQSAFQKPRPHYLMSGTSIRARRAWPPAHFKELVFVFSLAVVVWRERMQETALGSEFSLLLISPESVIP